MINSSFRMHSEIRCHLPHASISLHWGWPILPCYSRKALAISSQWVEPEDSICLMQLRLVCTSLSMVLVTSCLLCFHGCYTLGTDEKASI